MDDYAYDAANAACAAAYAGAFDSVYANGLAEENYQLNEIIRTIEGARTLD